MTKRNANLFDNPLPALAGILSHKGRGKQRGFTLIELLVVVLIIGILAAVAVPQYKFAIAKSHFAAVKPLLAEFKQAEEIYYLIHGNYTYNPSNLDLTISLWGSNNPTNGMIHKYFAINLNETNFQVVYCPTADTNTTYSTCSSYAKVSYTTYYKNTNNSNKSYCSSANNTLYKKLCKELLLN